MNNKEPTPISEPAQAPAALSLPASAGVAPISDSSTKTDDSNVEITTTDTSNTRESTTVVKSILRKQTTINNFYVKRPLQIIKTNLKAHNPKKRLHTNTSSTPSSTNSTNFTTMVSTPPAKRSKFPVPSRQSMEAMAQLGRLTPAQMGRAYDLAVAFALPRYITPDTRPRRDQAPFDGVPPRNLNNIFPAYAPTDYDTAVEYLSSGSDDSFAPNNRPVRPIRQGKAVGLSKRHGRGPNKWISPSEVLQALQHHYGFVAGPGYKLRLSTGVNRLQRTFSLALKIAGTTLSQDQISLIAKGKAERLDPLNRITRLNLQTITTRDMDHYDKHGDGFELHDILSGVRGSLYNDPQNKPPSHCVIILQCEATVPNKGTCHEHAIFLPDILMLITINEFEDMKDQRKRVRNTWIMRDQFYNEIKETNLANRRDVCNKRVGGKIFGGGAGTTVTLKRAVIVYKTP